MLALTRAEVRLLSAPPIPARRSGPLIHLVSVPWPESRLKINPLPQPAPGGVCRRLSPVGYGGLVEDVADVVANGPDADE